MNPRFCSLTGARRASARVAMIREAASDMVKSDDVNANDGNGIDVKQRNDDTNKTKIATRRRLLHRDNARKTLRIQASSGHPANVVSMTYYRTVGPTAIYENWWTVSTTYVSLTLIIHHRRNITHDKTSCPENDQQHHHPLVRLSQPLPFDLTSAVGIKQKPSKISDDQLLSTSVQQFLVCR